MERHLFALVGLTLLASALPAADKEETFPNGKVKAKYAVNDAERKHGAYVECYENGKVKIKTGYSDGDLDGAYASFHGNGKPNLAATYKKGKLQGDYKETTPTGLLVLKAVYRDGKLNGWRNTYDKGRPLSSQLFRDDECLVPRGLDEIKKKLGEILNPPATTNKTDPLTQDRQRGLNQLKAYRYLCYVPHENLTLDDELNKYGEAAAQLCEKIGRIDHNPPNPGLPKEQYDIAHKGVASSNLYMSGAGRSFPMLDSITAYMDDSDPSNIDRLGHRRWCLNPAMLKTGLGRSGSYMAMWSMDQSQKDVPDYDFVSFPPRGYLPTLFFKPTYAWSISLNPKKYLVPDASVQVKVFMLDKMFNKTGRPLTLGNSKVDLTRMGVPNCIIFRPNDLTLAGTRFWVEVEGVKYADDKPAIIHYLTEFVGS